MSKDTIFKILLASALIATTYISAIVITLKMRRKK